MAQTPSLVEHGKKERQHGGMDERRGKEGRNEEREGEKEGETVNERRKEGHRSSFSTKNNFFMGFFNTEIMYIDCPMIFKSR